MVVTKKLSQVQLQAPDKSVEKVDCGSCSTGGPTGTKWEGLCFRCSIGFAVNIPIGNVTLHNNLH